MIIFFGTRLFGKVDEVPGLFHVATEFFHISLIPILPLGSCVVLAKHSDGSYESAPFGLSFKSWMITWARVAMIFMLVMGFSLGATTCLDIGTPMFDIGTTLTFFLIGAVSTTALVFSYRLRGIGKASYERAMAIGTKIGMTPEGMQLIDEAFGMRDPSVAEMSDEELVAAIGEDPEPAAGSADETYAIVEPPPPRRR